MGRVATGLPTARCLRLVAARFFSMFIPRRRLFGRIAYARARRQSRVYSSNRCISSVVRFAIVYLVDVLFPLTVCCSCYKRGFFFGIRRRRVGYPEKSTSSAAEIVVAVQFEFGDTYVKSLFFFIIIIWSETLESTYGPYTDGSSPMYVACFEIANS